MSDLEGKVYEDTTKKSLPENGKEQPEVARFCARCGSPLDANVKFCGKCGAAVENGRNSGKEIQQLTENAKAVAKAGMNDAKRNIVKGMDIIGEKLSNASEKLSQETKGKETENVIETVVTDDDKSESEKEENSQKQGQENPETQDSEGVQMVKSVLRKVKKWVEIAVSVFVIVFLYWAFFTRKPINDVKDMVFDQYGSRTFGEAVQLSVPEASWDKEKLSNKHYTVTLSGFCPDLYSNIEVILDVNYSGDSVYGSVEECG